MKKSIRLISVLMAVLLMAGSGAACKKTGYEYETISDVEYDNVKNNDSDLEFDVSGNTDESTPTNSENSNKGVNNDKKIDGMGSDNNTVTVDMPLEKPVTFTWFTTEHALQPILKNSIKWSALKKATNVTLDIDFAQGTAAKTKLMAAAASGKMYDIVFGDYNQLSTYNSKLFINMTDADVKKNIPNYYNRVNNKSGFNTIKINGKSLFLGIINNNEGAEGSCYAPVIRYDILEKNNLPIPKTWDEWFTTMKRLKAIYPDSYPVSGRFWTWILKHWEEQLGEVSTIHFDNKTNKYTYGVLSNRYKTVLEFMNKCYNEGILDPAWASATDAKWNELVLADKTFFWIDNNGFIYSQTSQLKKSNSKAKMWIMPLMTNSFGEKIGYKIDTISFQSVYALSSSCKNKEALMKFMNWCYTNEGCMVNSLGQEGKTFTVKNGKISVPKSVWSKYSTSAQPNYSYMSDLGLGQLCFAPMYADGQQYWEGHVDTEDELGWKTKDTYDIDRKAGNYEEWVQIYPFVDSKTKSRADTIDAFIYTEVKKFINNARPLSEYDSFVADVKKMGAQGVLDAYNSSMKKK